MTTADDRLPMLLVVLDGLGDRPSDVLGGRTPAEAAATPVLDALAARGQSGLHVPFGPGRATSSELAHWSLFGFQQIAFPGRAALEGLGQGLKLPEATPMFHLALRAGAVRDGALYLGRRAHPRDDVEAAAALFGALGGRRIDGVEFELKPLRTGECVLVAHGAASRAVSDTDTLFSHLHPWLRPRAQADAADYGAAADLAVTLERWLLESRRILEEHPVNHQRRGAGVPGLDIPVTKWASWLDPAMPDFQAHIGLGGAAVTDSALYRGLARVLGMAHRDLVYDGGDAAADMTARLRCAEQLLADADFVHVHIKATDEAGHAKRPELKRDVIAATDSGLAGLLELANRAIIAVTGDHATPSVGSLLHSGDPTPLLVAGPGIHPDSIRHFGERHALGGALGRLAAADILPLLTGFANRPFFLGHRPGPRQTLALPNAPEPMPINASHGEPDE